MARSFAPGSNVGLHTGLITGTYAVALFLFAPLWGRWSDKGDRRRVLISGLIGFAVAMAAGATFPGYWGLYLSRFVGGIFAACIMPVAQAFVVDATDQHTSRARHFAWLGLASIAGLLGGPLIGSALGSGINRSPSVSCSSEPLCFGCRWIECL